MSKRTILILFSAISLSVLLFLCLSGERIIRSAYNKVLSSDGGLGSYISHYFQTNTVSTEEKLHIVICPELGRTSESKKKTRSSVIDALQTIIPYRPAVIGVDVFFEDDDTFFQVDSLCALAEEYGVQLVFAFDLRQKRNLNPSLFGFANLDDVSIDRFIPGPTDGYFSFPQLIVQKDLDTTVDVKHGLLINPSQYNNDNIYDSFRLDDRILQGFKGKIVLLGVNSQEDRWTIRGQKEAIQGVYLQRCIVNTIYDSLNVPRPSIWPFLLPLLFLILVFLKVKGPSFFDIFYDWIVFLLQLCPFLLLLTFRHLFYNPLFWKASMLLYIEIFTCMVLFPFTRLKDNQSSRSA